jgi:uncharacterized protein
VTKTLTANLLPVISLSDADRYSVEPSEESTRPRNPDVHLIETELGPHLFVVDGSRLYGLTETDADLLRSVLDDPGGVESFLAERKLDGAPLINDEPIASPPIRSLSLAVAQKCNLACTYCYAREGDFGGEAKAMSAEVAFKAVEALLRSTHPGERATLSFLGGEPMLNRRVVRRATEHAARLAVERGVRINFSITTNGTLLDPDDAAFFEEFGFAVTISVDGIGETHDRLRMYKSGSGSFERILDNVRPLLSLQRRMQVSARVTVTARNLELPRTLDHLVALGFHSVGFSPLLASPTGRDQLDRSGLETMLHQMTTCGLEFERRTILGERYPFSNMVSAMKEIHLGTHRPYPCGAGAGYLGVSADGDLAACHRFVGDESGAMGHLDTGVDLALQERWLFSRHVHRQEPCKSCWARYLCGGGCHHEVIARGRPACEYIRGWLNYCLGAYVRLLDGRPGYFG